MFIASMFCIWLVVSLYCHFQHITTIKTAIIWDKIEAEKADADADAVLFLREASLYNYDYKTISRLDCGRVAMKIINYLPGRIQIDFLMLYYFYDPPYRFYDKERVMHVCGYLLYEGDNEEMPDYGIYEPNGRRIDDGFSLRCQERKDFKFFVLEGKIYKPEINNVVLKVYNKRFGRKDRKLLLQRNYDLSWDRTITTNYFERGWGKKGYNEFDALNTDEIVYRILFAASNKEREKIKELIHPMVESKFRKETFQHLKGMDQLEYEKTTSFIGEYNDFKDVVKVEITHSGVIQQVLYFVYQDYQWWLVDMKGS